MRFYQQQHGFYCGVDLHAKTMHVCIVDQAGKTRVHKNIETRPDRFLQLIHPYHAHVMNKAAAQVRSPLDALA